MKKFFKSNFLVISITLILFIIPFFWIKPNEMDIGGDENRLFFYDPLHFLLTNGFFLKETITNGNRSYDPFFDYIPFVTLLLIFKGIFNSPYLLISLLNGVKVSISFLAVYLIIKTFIQNSFKEKNEFFIQTSSILGGLLYTTAPIVIENYDKALLSHDQIFLNPLCFYLILIYFIKGKFRYLLAFITTSLIFTTSFAWPSAPPLFSFFPFAIIFIYIYIYFILKKKINYLHLITAILLFFGLHAFHFLPEAYSLLSPNSYVNQRVFSGSMIQDDLNYFTGVLPLSKLSLNILLFAPVKQFVLLSVIPAFFIIVGFIFNKTKNKTFLLTSLFFLCTLYLVTANITKLGVKVYELFFYIPGFSMFRDFLGQWAFVFTFFYALLFGQAVYLFFAKINNKKVTILITIIIGISFVINSWSFFTGNVVNQILFQTNNVKIPMVMDPKYEQMLDYIRSLNKEGSFESFPFTDSYETVVHGLNNGAYEGPSPINWLAGRLDYNGYIEYYPFGDIFLKLVQNRDYSSIKKLLGILNVRYIYYNSDPKIYDTTFPGNPYSQFRSIFPKTQEDYKPFIKGITDKAIYTNGTYQIFTISDNYFNSDFYVPDNVKIYKSSQANMYLPTEPFFAPDHVANDVYLDMASCQIIYTKNTCSKHNQLKINVRPNIAFQKISPTMYKVHVTNSQDGYLLVFSDSFNKNWNISLTRNNLFKDIFLLNKLPQRQLLVNGYANAWYILPKDVNNKTDYTLIVQLTDQKTFYIGAVISILTFLLLCIYGILYYFKKGAR